MSRRRVRGETATARRARRPASTGVSPAGTAAAGSGRWCSPYPDSRRIQARNWPLCVVAWTQTASDQVTDERADLLAALASSRHFLRFTTRDLTDEQARQRTTTSELCLGG